MRFIILIVLIICSIQKIRAYEYTVKLQQVEVLDSAMFDAVIEIMQSDSLQAWVKEYHYPNRTDNIKNYRFVEVGFNRYGTTENLIPNDTTYINTSFTFTNHLHATFYTIYKNNYIYIDNHPMNQIENQKFIKPINKFKYIKYKTNVVIGNFIILVFNFYDGKLHICRNEIDWIITLE